MLKIRLLLITLLVFTLFLTPALAGDISRILDAEPFIVLNKTNPTSGSTYTTADSTSVDVSKCDRFDMYITWTKATNDTSCTLMMEYSPTESGSYFLADESVAQASADAEGECVLTTTGLSLSSAGGAATIRLIKKDLTPLGKWFRVGYYYAAGGDSDTGVIKVEVSRRKIEEAN